MAYSKGSMIAATAGATVIGFVLGFVPCLGGLVNMAIQLGLAVWALTIQYHGFRIQHGLSEGKALVCVLWWLVVACCLGAGLVFLAIGMIGAAGAQQGGGF